MSRNVTSGIVVLLWVVAACRPVIAIGWGEFLFFSLLLLVLLGPPIFKFIQRLRGFRKREKREK